MERETFLNEDRWLNDQSSIINEQFDKAAQELQECGIRLLAGSAPPLAHKNQEARILTLVPERFSRTDAPALSLSVLATKRGGPPRYVVSIQVASDLTRDALRSLVAKHPEIWEKAYLHAGFWVGAGADTELFKRTEQLTESGCPDLTLRAVVLFSDSTANIREAIMSIGLLYRAIFDEVSGAGKLLRLFAALENKAGKAPPKKFQRLIPTMMLPGNQDELLIILTVLY